MKGISPLVAIVLLIGITIVLATLLGGWIKPLFKYIAGEVEVSVKKGVRCAFSIDVISVRNDSVLISNPSKEEVTNVTIFADSIKLALDFDTLGSLETRTINWVRGQNTSIYIKGVCLEEIPVEGKCELGERCWKD
jgi:flagellin-like protein